MVRTGASIPVRIAINGRILEDVSSPFARLGAGELLRMLAGVPDLKPVLVMPEGAAIPHEVDFPLRQLPRRRGAWAGAAFDHWHFPREARRHRADRVLCLHASAPVSSPAPVISIYGDGDSLPSADGPGGRLARSLALAGLQSALAVLRPEDIPVDEYRLPWVEVPPMVPATFRPGPTADDQAVAGRLGLPPSYVLAACESEATLATLLAAWTWVEAPMGDSTSLLIANLRGALAPFAVGVADQLGLGNSVRPVHLEDLDWAPVLRGASALLHGGERGNAGLLRWAMASGLPVAALSTPITDVILGPAGFIVPERDSRGLGAACLTLLVEDQVASSLKEKGLERAAGYRSERVRHAWLKALTSFPRE